MILVRLMGGLGNQMFQYAAAKAVAIRNNSELIIDTTLLEINEKNPNEVVTHRKLDLEIFNLDLIKASQKQVEYFNGRTYRNLAGKVFNKLLFAFRKKNLIIEKNRSFSPEIIRLKDNKCLVGAWQSEMYFKDKKSEIKNEFTFKEPLLGISKNIFDEIVAHNSICVNVRRGDYVTSPIYSKTLGALSADYYNNGIKYFENKFNNPKVFVFSDDIVWCKNNLQSKIPILFVGHEHAGKKFGNYLQLMKLCNHFVIPNSTFGWWAAWLGEKDGTIVISPKDWVREIVLMPENIIPDRWMKIENDFVKID